MLLPVYCAFVFHVVPVTHLVVKQNCTMTGENSGFCLISLLITVLVAAPKISRPTDPKDAMCGLQCEFPHNSLTQEMRWLHRKESNVDNVH